MYIVSYTWNACAMRILKYTNTMYNHLHCDYAV